MFLNQKLKAGLIDEIDRFIREKIIGAGQRIATYAQNCIQTGDVILVFGASQVVLKALITAHQTGKLFRVIVCDSRPFYEGRELAKSLSQCGIQCNYILLTAVSHVVPEVTKCMLGAASLTSNGFVYARSGTALVALSCYSKNIPVIVCCETYKMDEKGENGFNYIQ